MSQTALQICNSSLIKLGARAISAFTDGTKEADLVVARYPAIRDTLLRAHVWRFASTRATLTADTDADLPALYTYQYSFPDDMALLLSLKDSNDQDIDDHERNGDVFYCDHSPVVIRYVRNFTDLDDGMLLPDDFAEALSCMLAADLCVSITQNQSLRDTYLQQHERVLAIARFSGSIERSPMAIEAGEWLNSRDCTDPIRPDRRGLAGY